MAVYQVIMNTIENSRLFQGLTPSVHAQLAQIAQLRTFGVKEFIFRAGDPADGIFIIAEGTVEVVARVSDTEQRVISQFGAGDFFGEMAVLEQECRSATVVAATPVKAYFVPRDGLLEILSRSPQLAISLGRESSRRLREFNRLYIHEVVQAERLSLLGRFAQSIVHDFKNPLGIIGFAAELGLSARSTPATRQLNRDRMRKQIDRLTGMIDELQEFTRGTQAPKALVRDDYGRFMHQLVEEIRPEAAERSVALILENPAPAAPVRIDPTRLSHLFYNLIHNAMDAMPNGGRVIFRFLDKSDEVVTEIEDTGKGIAPEVADRLFEPFATYGKRHGTGLGLSICRRIMEDHRGRICHRKAPHRGAIFVVTLPKAPLESGP